MARRLAFQKLILGLALAILPADLPSVNAQDPPQPPPPAKPGPQQRGRGFDPDMMLGMMKRPQFMLEVVKRDGGPLELLAPLMKPEIQQEMGLNAEQAATVDKFFADMIGRFEEDIKAHKKMPDVNWSQLFEQRLEAENKAFDEYLKGLPEGMRDRLIGIFVQYRNMRSLSNRVIAIEKLGMDAEAAKKLREDIHHIRWEVIRPNDEKVRREIMERGSMAEQTEQLKKTRAKIESRIEKLVDKERLEKLEQLKGKKLPDELIEKLDRPWSPGPERGGPERGGPERGGPERGGPERGGPERGGPERGPERGPGPRQ